MPVGRNPGEWAVGPRRAAQAALPVRRVVPPSSWQKARRQREFRAKRIYAQAMGEASRSVGNAERLRRGRRRRRQGQLALRLLVLAALIAAQHFAAHLADLRLVPAQDLLIGYPTAAFVAITGLLILPRR